MGIEISITKVTGQEEHAEMHKEKRREKKRIRWGI